MYHSESGDTHLLNKVDINILQRIEDTPISAEGLLTKFEHLFEGNADQYIQALLSNFTILGLIKTVDNEPAN